MLNWVNRREEKGKSYRSNDEWVQSIGSFPDERVLGDLRRILIRGLKPALFKYVDHELDQFVEDVAQDALLKILNKVHTFRGESNFVSWAMKIAVREGLSELRRMKWKDISIEDLAGNHAGGKSSAMNSVFLATDNLNPEKITHEKMVLDKVMDLIDNTLSDKQKTAITALMVRGISVTVVAEQMGMSRNNLYKVVHDARINLKKRMIAEGMDPDEILNQL